MPGVKKSNPKKWPGEHVGAKSLCDHGLADFVRYSQRSCRRYAATAREPRQERWNSNLELQSHESISCGLSLAMRSSQAFLASANERSRHSGGSSS